MCKKENMFHILKSNEHKIPIIVDLESRLAKSLAVGFLIVSLFLGLTWNF